MVASLRKRVAVQDGFTLIELITTLAILSIVLSGIIAMFVAGIHSEADMNERFQAQEDARTALSSLRNEVRSACGFYNQGISPGLADPAGGPAIAAMTSTQVTLGYCGQTATDFNVVQSRVTWCVAPNAGQYALYRQAGTTCSAATGARRADRLISTVTSCLPSSPPCPPNVFGIAFAAGDVRPRLTVALDVDVNPATSGARYHLDDSIAFRNWLQGVTP
jgi:prepilin-type N-terminal cleavage/methylation domain-containing protein